jgi:hypothetical protein
LILSLLCVEITSKKFVFSGFFIRFIITVSLFFIVKTIVFSAKLMLYNRKEKSLFFLWVKCVLVYGILVFDIITMSIILIFIQFVLRIDIFNTELPLRLYKDCLVIGFLIGHISFIGFIARNNRIKDKE